MTDCINKPLIIPFFCNLHISIVFHQAAQINQQVGVGKQGGGR